MSAKHSSKQSDIGEAEKRFAASDGSDLPFPPDVSPEETLDPHAWGMLAFLLSEVAFFSTLIVAYIAFLGHDEVGPTPREALSLGLVIGTTACLLASSISIHFALGALRRELRPAFLLWWGATIVLGAMFLAGTAYEWHGLFHDKQLSIGRNLFGTTFYTLVGFHALHVTIGVLVLAIVFMLVFFRTLNKRGELGVELVSWYWHFVDGVWVVVFTVVYLIGR